MSSRNTWSDGTPFSVASLNSLKHAFQGEGVESGGALSPGTGDWDVDITAVDYTVGSNGGFSLTADSVTVSNPGAEDRVDLITATTAPAFNVVEGSVASTTDQPNAPDIPTDEVLIGVVYVDSAATSLSSGDLFDGYKTPVQNVENWTTQGAADTVPVSQGDGSLAMGDPNTPAWEEDANSPLNGSGAQSHTLTLAESYDQVRVLIQNFQNNSGGSQSLQVRYNGDTGTNYEYTTADGVRNTTQDHIQIASGVDGFRINGTFDVADVQTFLNFMGPVGSGTDSGTVVTGRNTNVTSPLDSLTFRGGSGNVAITARVFGWNGGM